ncbi:hypothetical protein RJ639_006595 [Escallonia herrerae]|uniref:WAT1-related protein n=1 Tax=Escallonia herrerae TaxID=1293975 RepID=A0AA88VYW1_9ASTE|nr:hypothetical protein RJ639_006595 [Escallonia herrerae]
MAKQGRYCYKEVLPFVAMIFLQCTQVALSIIFKAATLKGMSYRVFIVYSYALSGLVLLPFAFIFESFYFYTPSDSCFSMINWSPVLSLLVSFWQKKASSIGSTVAGASSQLCGYKGIEYSSPTLASAISNLAPAFTFVLAIFCRMEKIEIRSLSSQAKIIGTILSILGALVVVIYKGPTLVRTSSNPSVLLYQPLKSSESDWIAGGLLLTADYILFSIWYIVQGLYGSSFATVILTWALRLKGPVYVALFTPLSIAIAAIMSGIFLGDSLYLGRPILINSMYHFVSATPQMKPKSFLLLILESAICSVIGAVIISVGFYVVIWGKAKEDLVEDEGLNSSESPSPESDPLLQ